MKTYKIELIGETPILMHADNINWRDSIKKWTQDPQNKKKTVPGDDRTPAFTWLGYMYHDEKRLGIPSDCLMSCIRCGATLVSAGGKKSFKVQSQAGILVNEIMWPIKINGKEIEASSLLKLVNELDFEKHEQVARDNGFSLFVKSAKIGKAKHVRVRPRFENWTCSGTVTVFDDTITKTVLEQIWQQAGFYVGLLDWRPGSRPSPGQFGKFTAKITEI